MSFSGEKIVAMALHKGISIETNETPATESCSTHISELPVNSLVQNDVKFIPILLETFRDQYQASCSVMDLTSIPILNDQTVVGKKKKKEFDAFDSSSTHIDEVAVDPVGTRGATIINQTEIIPSEQSENLNAGGEKHGMPGCLKAVTEDIVQTGEIISGNVLPKKRRKNADKTLWKRSVMKHQRLSGKAYINRGGKEVKEKHPLPVNCATCRYKCNENFCDELREVLCHEYWGLADYDKQKLHLSSLIKNVAVQRKLIIGDTSKRSTSRLFYLKDETATRHRVCLNFFCRTFCISHRVIETCMKHVANTGTYEPYNVRSNKKPHNITSNAALLLVKEHIDSFPRIESHYCRRDSSKHYLGSDLNLSILYRLYLEFCRTKNAEPVSKFVYQKTFHSYEPVLDFFSPKKDQCFKCSAFNTAKDKEPLRIEHEQHKKREKDALDMKKADKERSVTDQGKSFRALTFDMQAILSVPFAGDNQIFYKLKLNVYNFTIFDASNSDGHCYIWDETHGKKGSTEIGTCLLKYIRGLPKSVTHVSTFSDTCGGQNRNKHVAAAMLYAVSTISNIKTIDLKFMETGHSYMEVDSMHATIERARKHSKIYTTREWSVLVSAARRRPKPYTVHNLTFEDFHDLQKLSLHMIQNTSLNTKNEKVKWLKIKWLRFEEEKPSIIKYKYDLLDEGFEEINVTQKRSLRGESHNWASLTLCGKYKKRLPVSEKKKGDLVSLLRSGIIPQEYTSFIEDVPSTSQKVSPESDE